MDQTVTLFTTFKNSLGNSCTLTIEDPRPDITEEEVIAFMNLVIAKNIFQPKGYDIVTPVSAKIVNANTTTFDLEV